MKRLLLLAVLLGCEETKKLIDENSKTDSKETPTVSQEEEVTVRPFNPTKKIVPVHYVKIADADALNSIAEVDRVYYVSGVVNNAAVLYQFAKNTQNITFKKLYDMGSALVPLSYSDTKLVLNGPDSLYLSDSYKSQIIKINTETMTAESAIDSECGSFTHLNAPFEKDGYFERIYQNHKVICDMGTGVLIDDKRIIDSTTGKMPKNMTITGQWAYKAGFYYQYDPIEKVLNVFDTDYIQVEAITTSEMQLNGTYSKFTIDSDGDFVFIGCVSKGCYYSTTTVEAI